MLRFDFKLCNRDEKDRYLLQSEQFLIEDTSPALQLDCPRPTTFFRQLRSVVTTTRVFPNDSTPDYSISNQSSHKESH
jgi:hypothetical protein